MRSDQLEESINLTVGLLSQNPLIKDFLRKIGQENNAGKGSWISYNSANMNYKTAPGLHKNSGC